MRKHILNQILFLLLLLLFGLPSTGVAATMLDYCQTPPFIGSGGEPNVMVVDDASGSMTWPAYSPTNDSNPPSAAVCSSPTNTQAYEGYFDPLKTYAPDPVTGIYSEVTPTTVPCTITCTAWQCKTRSRNCSNAGKYGSGNGAFGCSGGQPYGCCTAIQQTGGCNVATGSYLNCMHMHRVDIIRWALTGGNPTSCPASSTSSNNPDPNYCDPELYNQTGNSSKIGSACSDTLALGNGNVGGCTLLADDGTKVNVTWGRVKDGLAYQFQNLPVKPRLGAMVFSDTGASSSYVWKPKVYLGDFLASNNNSAQFPYQNFIALINSVSPNGGTPTGPALWDALNYYAMNAPQFGGFPQQSGSGDRWKNPLYVCDGGGGNNCVLNTCARNFVMLMSDGDWNSPSSLIGNNPSCTTGLGNESADPVVPAYCMHEGVNNLMGGSPNPAVPIKVNGVYTVGLFMGAASTGTNAMENIAMYGSFDNSVKTWPDSLTGFPNPTTYPNGSLTAPLPASSPDWDANGDHIPDTFYSGSDAMDIKQKIMDAVLDMLSHVTSGTAASVLASGEGSGANLVQATYYPRRKFSDNAVNWIGSLQNLWYWIDPNFTNSNIREDGGAKVLNLQANGLTPENSDYIVQFYYDGNEQKAKANIYSDTNGDGAADALINTVDFEQLNNLWEAGVLLWNRAASDRTIYTPLDTTQLLTADANKFSVSTPDNTAALRPLLNTDASTNTNVTQQTAENNQLAQNVVNYVRGVDLADYTYTAGTGTVAVSYRPRTAKIDLNNDGNVTDTSVTVSGVLMDETVGKVWKLGDIVDSTPRISSWVQLNTYDTIYADAAYGSFISSATYTTRGMVFTGANDGMLHAFNLGSLQLKWTGQNSLLEYARLLGTDLGKEKWAFIPRNTLPYLQYLADPNYGHIFTVDLTPYIFDASINKPSTCGPSTNYWDCTNDVTSWRTILIGGMRLGGASRDASSSCNNGTTDCVKTPISGNGYSSYFALDVTDQNNPILLWEFPNPSTPLAVKNALGFSTSGPAVVRISSRTDSGTTSSAQGNATNGKWFVVLASGPTGPIEQTSQKFLAHSDQTLQIFILDLTTGNLVRQIDTQIPNAFAGSIFNATHDADHKSTDYQDDVIYIPYVKQCAVTDTQCTAGQWNDGGILRLLTNKKMNGTVASGNTALNPANWVYNTLIDGIGPVTSAVAHAQNTSTGQMWLYFGTGRYYYKNSSGTDDANTIRTLYGISDPCFAGGTFLSQCLAPLSGLTRYATELSPIDLTGCNGSTNTKGWYINLEAPGVYSYMEGTPPVSTPRYYDAERVITDPLATSNGIIFYTSFKPYSDKCSIGGKSFIWAVAPDGGCASNLQGTALIQVSTGAIVQLNLASAFNSAGGRKSTYLEGVPPTGQGLSIIATPNPVMRIIHMRER